MLARFFFMIIWLDSGRWKNRITTAMEFLLIYSLYIYTFITRRSSSLEHHKRFQTSCDFSDKRLNPLIGPI